MRNYNFASSFAFLGPQITISKMAARCHLGKPNFSKQLSLNVSQHVILEFFLYEESNYACFCIVRISFNHIQDGHQMTSLKKHFNSLYAMENYKVCLLKRFLVCGTHSEFSLKKPNPRCPPNGIFKRMLFVVIEHYEISRFFDFWNGLNNEFSSRINSTLQTYSCVCVRSPE